MLPIKSLEVAVSLALSTKPVNIFTDSVAINATTNIFIAKLNIVPIAFSDKNFNCPITPNGKSGIVINANLKLSYMRILTLHFQTTKISATMPPKSLCGGFL